MSNVKQSATKAIERELPRHTQNLLWYIFELRDNPEETHCFELEATTDEYGKSVQKVTHTFTVPLYQKEHRYSDKSPVESKVIIRSGDFGLLMMLASEQIETNTNTNNETTEYK